MRIDEHPALNADQQDFNLIGIEFEMNSSKWRVQTSGIKDWWGVVSLKTNSFISMSTREIQKFINE